MLRAPRCMTNAMAIRIGKTTKPLAKEKVAPVASAAVKVVETQSSLLSPNARSAAIASTFARMNARLGRNRFSN